MSGRSKLIWVAVAGSLLIWIASHGSKKAAVTRTEASAPATDTITISGISEAGEVKGGETYSEYDERRDELDGSAGSYAGNGCIVDCGGHSAGYEWAADHGITDPDECGGKSWSFEEGCRSYAEEQREDEERSSDET